MGLLPDQQKIYSSETFSSENLYMRKNSFPPKLRDFLLSLYFSFTTYLYLLTIFSVNWI